jgi:anti-sigma factor RsiW
MNDCPNGEIRDLLPDYLHGRLDPAARQAVDAHVRECATCQEELELLRGMNRALHHVPAVRVGAIVAALPAYRAPVRRAWGGWRAAAVIAFVAAGGTTIVVARHSQMPTVAGDSAAVASVPVASGAQASVASSAARELAVASAAFGDLDERELTVLLDNIGTLDAVPSVEVEPAAPVTIAPSSPTGIN